MLIRLPTIRSEKVLAVSGAAKNIFFIFFKLRFPPMVREEGTTRIVVHQECGAKRSLCDGKKTINFTHCPDVLYRFHPGAIGNKYSYRPRGKGVRRMAIFCGSRNIGNRQFIRYRFGCSHLSRPITRMNTIFAY